MINDRDYREIASDVYRVDKRKYSSYLEEKIQLQTIIIKFNLLRTTKITECRQMEVTRINSVGEVDTRQIVIA